jgi:CRP-like cAMP-binding protein
MFDNYPRSATAQAVAEVVTYKLDRPSFFKLIDSYPRLGVKILLSMTKIMSQRLRQTDQRLVEIMIKNNSMDTTPEKKSNNSQPIDK